MLLKETLKNVLRLQKAELLEKEKGIPREIFQQIDIAAPQATIISGIRRCGKSTLLQQLMKKVKISYYCNFEDPRLFGFGIEDFEKLITCFDEDNPGGKHYFFDEIQNVPGWEKQIRSLLDRGKRCIITGSNASLLSRELGTLLTGRHLTYELFPFSYKEMLMFVKKTPSLTLFEEYAITGGFPEFLLQRKTEYLQELMKDILFRDIIVRHKLREAKIIQEIAIFLITNGGKEFSYNNIAKIFSLGSPNTVIAYVHYFEDSYLLLSIPRADFSYKKQLLHPKKCYSIDVGLTQANSASFSQDKGRILENLIFLHLKKKYKDIFYFKGKNECDFIVKQKGEIILALQVCVHLTEENKEREIIGLQEALNTFKLKKGILITLSQEETFGSISVVPAWKWLSE